MKSYIAGILEKGSKIVLFSFLLALLVFYFISERRVCSLKIAERKGDVRLFSSLAIHIPLERMFIYIKGMYLCVCIYMFLCIHKHPYSVLVF